MMDTSWILDFLLIVMLLFCSGFFSGSETGLTAISRARIFKLASEGDKRAMRVSKLRERKEELIGAILLGNNLVNIAATAIATSLAIRLFGEGGVFIVTIVLTLAVLIFAEVLPKTYAIQNAEKVALFVAPVLSVVVMLFSPITKLVQWVIMNIMKLFRLDMEGGDTLISSTDVIRGTIELHHQEGDMVKQERDMLGGILDLGEIEVEEVMIHRKHIEMVDISLPVKEIIHKVIHSAHSRIPFWQDHTDNIIGLLHVKDLVRLIGEHKDKVTVEMIRGVMSKPWFVPETTSLREQLLAFRNKHRHFAHVIDEYGSFQGIITLEDIIEEIVGEISDEHDRHDSSTVVVLEDGSVLLDGTVSIRDLNREFDWNLPDEDASTIGGLVIHEARLIPEVGAVFAFYGCQFVIVEKRANQILKLAVRKMEPETEEG